MDRKVEVLDAYSTSESLELFRQYNDIAVALIDIFVDKDPASGLELVQKIRNELHNTQLRIILRSRLEGDQPQEELFVEYDINDYKEKGELTIEKLRTPIINAFRSFNDLQRITNLNNSLEKKVQERTRALSEANLKLRTYISRLENDQEAGGRMQQKLLPDTQKSFGDCTFASRIYTSMYLSGDFLDYFEIDADRVGFYMADVSGHGISSAFITVLLKNFVDTQLENYWNEGDQLIMRPYLLVKKLNSELLRENFGKYLTIFYGVLDQKRNTLRYTNCGQFPYPLLRENGKVNPLEPAGTPVGLFVEPEFMEEEIPVSKESALLIISDGILELLPQASVKEKRNLIRHFFSFPETDLQELTEQLGLSRQYSFPDDITFLMLKRSADNGSR
ncbi:MAG: fused response regulator/phosphatase [Spirochaetia bacterium]|nr:fused response regulator/phosphatase [Spirochaetia bacterium]